MSTSEYVKPLVIAHRGVHTGGIVENTFAAFEAAVGAGAEMIELDVRRTGAGELVILHDHKLKNVVLESVTLDEFEQRTGLRPPLLGDVLAWAQGKIALDVELKEHGYVDQLAPLLKDFQQQGGELIVTSFQEAVLTELSELAPQLECGLLLSFTAQMAAARTKAVKAAITLPEMALVNEAVIQEVITGDLDLIVWDYIAGKHGPELMNDPRVRAVITDDVPGALDARD